MYVRKSRGEGSGLDGCSFSEPSCWSHLMKYFIKLTQQCGKIGITIHVIQIEKRERGNEHTIVNFKVLYNY